MKCVLDMDGVLCDFVGAVEKKFGIIVDCWEFDNKIPGLSRDEFWDSCNYYFWSNLQWTSDGKAIVEELEGKFGKENICLLTSPCRTERCMDGKLKWISKNLPQYERRFLMGPAKEFAAGINKLLVDDSDNNEKAFQKAGGHTILIPRKWNRLSWLLNQDEFNTQRYLREALQECHSISE